MGIRVHKVIGYGVKKISRFLDLDKFEEQLSDDSLYSKSFYDIKKLILTKKEIIEEMFEGAEGYKFDTRKGIIESGTLHGELRRVEENGSYLRTWSITNFIRYDYDDIDAGFVIIPFGNKDWFRYDDIMDYYEETGPDGPKNRFTQIPKLRGIYPYLGIQKFREPAEDVNLVILNEAMRGESKLSPSTHSQLVGWWSPDQKAKATGKLFKHLLLDYRPVIPMSVGMILSVFSNSISDCKVLLNKLRPCIYVYWG